MTRTSLEKQRIRVLNWPANSPDLNVRENVWGYLSRQVYSNGSQYDSVDELREAIFKAYNNIYPEFIETILGSIKNSKHKVLVNKSNATY